MKPTNKICVSVAEPTAALCHSAVAHLPFAELRLDAMQVCEHEVRALFAAHPCLIATCRPGRYDDAARCALLVAAIEAGAALVDTELDAADAVHEAVQRAARSTGCRHIVSHHDMLRTPCAQELTDMVARCHARGADLAKIACMVNTGPDVARLLGLLDSARPPVVVGMGKLGALTRVAAPLLGAPFTYAARSSDTCTAPGQLDYPSLDRLLRELG